MMRTGAPVLVLAALLAAVAACVPTDDTSLRTQEASVSPPPAEGMRGITLRNFRQGDTRWVLQADTASVYRDRKRVEAQKVTIDFFDGERHVSKLTSERGVLLQATDDLEARGHVRVVTDDGAILTTDVLFWDHQHSKIHTDDPVQITRGDDVIHGIGLEADPGLSRIDLKREVRGSLRSNPDSLLPEAGK